MLSSHAIGIRKEVFSMACHSTGTTRAHSLSVCSWDREHRLAFVMECGFRGPRGTHSEEPDELSSSISYPWVEGTHSALDSG